MLHAALFVAIAGAFWLVLAGVDRLSRRKAGPSKAPVVFLDEASDIPDGLFDAIDEIRQKYAKSRIIPPEPVPVPQEKLDSAINAAMAEWKPLVSAEESELIAIVAERYKPGEEIADPLLAGRIYANWVISPNHVPHFIYPYEPIYWRGHKIVLTDRIRHIAAMITAKRMRGQSKNAKL